MTMTAPLKRIASLHVERRRNGADGVLSLDAVESRTGRLMGDPWSAPVIPPETGVADAATGDVLFGKLRPYLAKVIHLDRPAYASTELMCLRAKAAVDSRWFFYRMIAHPTVEWSVATSEGTKMPRTSWERLGEFRVHVPELGKQRAIANYLDIETARIDAIVAKKQRLRSALRERHTAIVRLELGHHEGVRLKHLLAAPLAYGVLVPLHDPEGIPMLRITDLRTGVVDLSSVTRIPKSLSSEFRRTILRDGDLVVSVVGTLGRSLEVTPQLIGANLNRALARVQLKNHVPQSLVRLWFQSQDFQLQARLATSGDSAQPTLGLGDMKNFNVGIPRDSSRWAEITDRTLRRLAPIEATESKLQKQERLLVEHRQALITAAVTGELEIPGEAS